MMRDAQSHILVAALELCCGRLFERHHIDLQMLVFFQLT